MQLCTFKFTLHCLVVPLQKCCIQKSSQFWRFLPQCIYQHQWLHQASVFSLPIVINWQYSHTSLVPIQYCHTSLVPVVTEPSPLPVNSQLLNYCWFGSLLKTVLWSTGVCSMWEALVMICYALTVYITLLQTVLALWRMMWTTYGIERSDGRHHHQCLLLNLRTWCVANTLHDGFHVHQFYIHRPRTPQVPHSAIHDLAIHTTRPRTPQVPHSAIHNLAIQPQDHVHHEYHIQPSTTSTSIPQDHIHHKYHIQPSTTSPSIPREHVHHEYHNHGWM